MPNQAPKACFLVSATALRRRLPHSLCIKEKATVRLKQVFKTRGDRAVLLLENPEASPKKICFSSADLSCSEKLEKLHGQFPKKKQGVTYLY